MKSLLAALASCSLSFAITQPLVPAQTTPASPAVESTAIFTAAEAHAFAAATALAEAWRAGETPKPSQERNPWPGYRLLAARFEGEQLMFLDRGADPSRAFAAGDTLCYFVPERAGEQCRRVFCVRGDGLVACTDNRVGTAAHEARTPLADDVLGEGGRGTLRDFPRTPSQGRDGNLWLPAEMVERRTLRLSVVDERGEPMAMVGIATAVVAEGEGCDTPVPAGAVRTLMEGDAVLLGVPATGLGFVVTRYGTTMGLPKSAVRIDGATARITVARSLLHRLTVQQAESAAIATMKNLSSAQCQCQASGVIDVDGDGAGEYGTFAELSGRHVLRGQKQAMAPPVMSTAFSKVKDGVVVRSGYCFRVFLPGKDKQPVPELAGGGPDAAAIEANQAETIWCAYAWPVEPGVSGQRAFFIDQSGDVMASPNQDGRYGGTTKMPGAEAARAAGSSGKLDAKAAANAVGIDGQPWAIVM